MPTAAKKRTPHTPPSNPSERHEHDSSDLAELRKQLEADFREQYFYAALLGLRNYEPLNIHERVRNGLAYSALERFQRSTCFSAARVASIVQLPRRTLARRKEAGRLDPVESDRLLRASRVFGRALELFEGDRDAARQWLSSEQPMLGNRIPLELATTDVGVLEVERLIGRLEHGVPA